MLNATYTMDRSVPSTFTSSEYRNYVTAEWQKLLNSSNVQEKDLQEFLEEHPCILPFQEIPLDQGQGSTLSSAVVTQPVLTGLKSKVPDFLYFTGSSAEITAVLVEIESPSKKWFTNSGQPTAELTQAASQIKSWKTWFSDPINILSFERDYKVREYGTLNARQFIQKYILVIGRRNDIVDPTLNKTRHHLQCEDEIWMTYDRLQYSNHWDDAVMVQLDRSGATPQFQVKHVPPIIKLGPQHYPNYHSLVGVAEAINRNTLISDERKAFLVNRLPYWKNWHTTNVGLRVVNGSDLAGE